MEKILKFEDVELCTESFGDKNNEAILLIMGATSSMVWWDSNFCNKLADSGFHVIRYDNRDTGKSTCYGEGNLQYSIEDMVDDAIRILDYYKIEKANIVGISLGGMIGELISLEKPERVKTLTLISSSVFGPEDTRFPNIDKNILEYFNKIIDLDWKDKKAVLDYIVKTWEITTGKVKKFEENRIRKLAEEEIQRASDISSMMNHTLLDGGEKWYGRIGEIKVPVLIIHGTKDPVFPYEYAVELNKLISGSKLLPLEETGHEFREDDWDFIISGILELINNGINKGEKNV